jgi:uncharacterized integral membrane protein
MRVAVAYTQRRQQVREQSWGLGHWLGYILLLVLLLSMINGVMPQIEMAIFSGHVQIPTVVLKLLMIAIAVLGVLIKRKLGTPAPILLAWATLVTYLFFEAVFFTFFANYSLIYIVYSFESTLYFLLLLPLLYAFKETVDERQIATIITWLFVPLVSLGIWQSVTNDPILPTISVDQYFQVYSWDFYGRVRAFSLFGSASNFGHYLALVAAMSVAALGQCNGRRKSLAAIGFVLALVATYMTLTRATYVEVLLAVTTAALVTFFKWRGIRLSLLWGVYAGIGLFVAFVAPAIIAGLRGTDHLFADASLLIRYEEWAHYSGIWLNHGVATMLLGTGLMQSSRFALTQKIVIDNVWLSLLFQFGLVGFLIILAFIWQLWKTLMKGLQAHPRSILTIGVVSSCSTFPFTSIFGITTLDYLLLFTVWLISRKA